MGDQSPVERGLHEKVLVRTTRAIIPPFPEHPVIHTSDPKVFLRPFRADDLASMHVLRTQDEVMRWTSVGVIDADEDTTNQWMRRFMAADETGTTSESVGDDLQEAEHGDPPRSFNFVIVHSDPEDQVNGERIIGTGGFHILDPEAEVGYMICKEYWGRGIATTILRALVDAFWRLERESVTLEKEIDQVDASMHNLGVDGSGNIPVVPEVINATIDNRNGASKRVLEKCGFIHKRDAVVEENGAKISLGYFVAVRPGST